MAEKFCAKCGIGLPGNAGFCLGCGAPQEPAEAVQAASTSPPQPQPVQQPPRNWWKRRSTLVKVVIVVGVLAVIGAIVGATQAGDGDEDRIAAVVTTSTTRATTTTARPTTTLPPTTTTTESEEAFKAKCEKIAYKVISKNPDSLLGNFYRFKGEIFQIMEDSGETFMIISVTRIGSGFWTDNIAVQYLGTVDVYEEDIVNIWGMCTGTYSYTSVAGYEISIPGMLAAYVEKTK